jgi:transaldolase
VSLEVSPYLARDSQGTIDEARSLWRQLDRPNVMIKVPGTKEGLRAIEQLTGEGLNVNVTLLFGLRRYRQVAEAYIAGLEARAAQGQPLDHVRSVASFFLSRIDALVDPKLEEIMSAGGPDGKLAGWLHGQLAIASARVAYQIYHEIFGSERFDRLADRGAHPQRLLWASTSTKNPAYSDVRYVEALIGPETINTIPLETWEAYRDHGDPALRLEEAVDEARERLESLSRLGIDLDQVTQQLEEEGVAEFSKSLDQLLAALRKQRDSIVG